VRKGTVGYLYDRVSGKLFGNAGTGDFVLGPDVVPVEYIESHGTEWIDTGIKLRSTDTIDTRLYINSSNTASWYGILGSRDSARYLILRCFSGNAGKVNVYPSATYDFTRFTWGNLSFAFGGDYHESATNCYLFTYNNNGSGYTRLPYRFANFSITRDSSKIINFRPVRVGTDATSWEGAMMDVLTRRIYRNAGTGAFTYGNDLKYPTPSE
jgi:hypothetical protein